jgi:hypothetical protein
MPESSFKYEERLIGNGQEQRIDYRKRNRRVVMAVTHSEHASIKWDSGGVLFKGPVGSEATVVFSIGA